MGAPTAPRKQTARKATVRKATAAAAKATSTTRVVLDLDTLTKAKALPDLNLPTKPFTFRLDGNDYELRDPRDSDWKLSWQLAANPFLLMRNALVGADDPIDDPTEQEIENARERIRLAEENEGGGGVTEGGEGGEEPEIVPLLIDRFTAVAMPGWKLNALFDNWHSYYKIDLSDGKGILPTLLGLGKAD